MCSDSVVDQKVILATGVAHPLILVAAALTAFEGMLNGVDGDKGQLAALRRAGLDNSPVEEKYAKILAAQGMVNPGTRQLDPIIRDLVLATVRGEGDNLYLISPYATFQDRMMSNLITSITFCQRFLPPNQVADLLVPPDDDNLGPWTRRAKKGSSFGIDGPGTNN